MNITKAFELAKKASEFSDCKIKMGCVVMYKNKVISTGYNNSKSHPMQKYYNQFRSHNGRVFNPEKHDNTIHAECMALRSVIRGFKGDFSKLGIFVYSEKKNGSTRLSKPCRACQKLLSDYGIKNMYYVNNDGDFIYEIIDK